MHMEKASEAIESKLVLSRNSWSKPSPKVKGANDVELRRGGIIKKVREVIDTKIPNWIQDRRGYQSKLFRQLELGPHVITDEIKDGALKFNTQRGALQQRKLAHTHAML